MKLRQMAAAFLCHHQCFLMMKRAETRELAPGLWAPVGGHLENGELNDPEAACLREIAEETGIAGAQIRELQLKYLILRRKEDEIRVQYVFFGESATEWCHQTPEGRLDWIPRAELLDLALPVATRFVLEHYFETESSNGEVYVGCLNGETQAEIAWTVLSDWERNRIL